MNVKLDERIHRFLTRALANAQVSHLPAGWAYATGLNAHFVEPTLLRPRISKPVGKKRVLDISGKEEVTQRPLDSEAVQRGLLLLSAAIT